MERRAELRVLAERQAAAWARMVKIGEGIGGLAVRDQRMADDIHAWGDVTENDFADVVLDALDALDRVEALHEPTPYWIGEDPATRYGLDGERRDPDGYICLTCSDGQVEYDLDNWELDPTSDGVVEHPCATVKASRGDAS